MSLSHTIQLKRRNAKAHAAGEGTWVHKTTLKAVRCEVSFYPKTKLWLMVGDKRTVTTMAEMSRDYDRFQV